MLRIAAYIADLLYILQYEAHRSRILGILGGRLLHRWGCVLAPLGIAPPSLQIKRLKPIDKKSAAAALCAGKGQATLGAKNGNNKKFLFSNPFFCDQSPPKAGGTAREAQRVAAPRKTAPVDARSGKAQYKPRF